MNNHIKLMQAFLFHISLFLSTSASEYVPALIWESNPPTVKNRSFPSLAKWPSGDFSGYITSKLNAYNEKPLVVVFLSEYLNIEDWRPDYFPLLQDLTNNSSTTLITSVEKPLVALQQIEPTFTVIDIENEQKQLPYNNYNGTALLVIKINITNQKETRIASLPRHDQIIHHIYKQLSMVYPNILAIHTGMSSLDYSDSLQRTPRAVEENTTDTNHTGRLWRATSSPNSTNGMSSIFLYFFDHYPTLTDYSNATDNTTIELTSAMIHDGPSLDEPYGSQRLILRFRVSEKYYITLRFRFVYAANGYWSLPIVEYENSKLQTPTVLTTLSRISAPFRYSYHCSETAMVFRNGTTSLVLRDFQTQPFLRGERFAESCDCVGFFTVAIWSGILVVALLAGIFVCGMTMIMDIRTMDRFEDPKGPTITVNIPGAD